MKQSGLAKAYDAGYMEGLRVGRKFMRQLMFDLACIALNETEGMGLTASTDSPRSSPGSTTSLPSSSTAIRKTRSIPAPCLTGDYSK